MRKASFYGTARRGVKISLLAGVALASVSPALGQDGPAGVSTEAASLDAQALISQPQTEQEQGQDIVVTGSLVAKSGFDMPTPVTVINEQDLARVGSADISDVVNQIPSVRASLTNDSTANQSSAAGGTFADLRGLGAQRTLVLVDGRRLSPSNGSGAVSTAALPQAAISGVDVVTGGTSAAYGSDAVAGVINYKIDDRLKGFRGRLQGGMSEYGDYENYLASIAFGTSMLDGRIRLIAAGELSDNRGIQYQGDRPWNDGVQFINNPAYTETNNEPRTILVNGARAANRTLGGLITSAGPLRNIHFLSDGSAVPFRMGTLATASTMVGGDGAPIRNIATGSVPQKRNALYGRITFDVSDAFSFFVEGNYALLRSKFQNGADTGSVTIRAANPFLPQSIRDVMTAQNIASFTLARNFEELREVRDLDVETVRILTGANGKFGGSWDWDVYYSGGRTDNTSHRLHSRLATPFTLAVDAVTNPANGAIVCRSTLTDPTNGCVPLNLLGEGRASQAAIDYVLGDGWHTQYIEQHVVAGKVRGEPFSTWAGPVGVAVGAEARWLRIDATADPLNTAFAFTNGGYTPWAGDVHVKEAFGEVLVPLAKDVRFAEHLSLNLAGRVTDYSTSGTVYTWKVGANYSPIDSLRFRATRSRDIRAPSLEELYLGGSSANGSVIDPVLKETYSITVRNTGNPLLTPEIADTFSAGVIVNPARGLQLSVDYWDIFVDKAIVNLGTAPLVRQCYEEGNAAACQTITRFGSAPTDRIQYVVNGPINFNSMSARGVDFEVSYRTSLGAGKLDLRALATYFHRGYIISEETGTTELHNSVDQGTPKAIGGNPFWKVNTRVTYSQGGAFISLAGRYVGGGRIDPTADFKDMDVLRVNGRVYFDASAEYPLFKRGGDSVALFANVRNLLDTTPPLTGESSSGTTRSLYDVIGRLYSAGVKFRF